MSSIWMNSANGGVALAEWDLDTGPFERTKRLHGDQVRQAWFMADVTLSGFYVVETFTSDLDSDLCGQYRRSYSTQRFVVFVSDPVQVITENAARIAFSVFRGPAV